LLSYLMYPQVFLSFDQKRQLYGDVSVLPTPQFYYGMEPGEEILVELEPGKTLIIKFLTVGEPHPEGKRTVFFELNGQPREVSIQDESLKAQSVERAKADPAHPGHVGAPIPGAVTSIIVEAGENVSKGDRLLVIEAMKMQTTVYASVAGKVVEKLVQVGETVDTKDLLIVLGPSA
jgi:pyruvate carboxylase